MIRTEYEIEVGTSVLALMFYASTLSEAQAIAQEQVRIFKNATIRLVTETEYGENTETVERIAYVDNPSQN